MSLRLWLQRQLGPQRSPSWSEERALIHSAFIANDEKQMRGHWERLHDNIAHNGALPYDALKPIYAGRSYSQWLVKQGRFPEAELVLLRVIARPSPDWRESVKVLFLFADAMWGQNERARAEREALAPLQEMLGRVGNDVLTCRWRARLAFYRLDFESQAHYLEQSFAAPLPTYGAPLTPTLVAWDRLDCATAWSRAGNNARSRAQIETVVSYAPTLATGSSAHWRLFFAEIDDENWEVAGAVIERVNELTGDETGTNYLKALLALEMGDLDACDSWLETLPEPKGEALRRRNLYLAIRSRVARGEFDEARTLYKQYETVSGFLSPENDYARGSAAFHRAYFEMRAQAYKNCGDLDIAKSRLKFARSLLRGSARAGVLLEASEIGLIALQGQHALALEKAGWLEEMFERWDEFPLAQHGVGRHLLNLFETCGESAQVLRWGERLLQQWPKDGDDLATLLTLAHAHAKEGNSTKARESLERAAQGNPNLLVVRMARRELDGEEQ